MAGGAGRPTTTGGRDVEHVIITVELGQMLNERGIDLTTLPEEVFDSPLGPGSGSGQLFSTTGGVMEAALRTVVELISGQPMASVVFEVSCFHADHIANLDCKSRCRKLWPAV